MLIAYSLRPMVPLNENGLLNMKQNKKSHLLSGLKLCKNVNIIRHHQENPFPYLFMVKPLENSNIQCLQN